MNEVLSVTSLKGIGEKKALLLKKLNIFTIEDLLLFYPRTYQDRTNFKKIRDAKDGEEVLINARVLSFSMGGNPRSKKQFLKVQIDDGSAQAELIFFNAYFLQRAFKIGESYSFFGVLTRGYGKTRMTHPEFLKGESEETAGIYPVYQLCAGLSQGELRKWQKMAQNYIVQVEDYLPQEICDKYKLAPLDYALRNVHFPKDRQSLKEARYRLIFDEFLLLLLGLFRIKDRKISSKGIRFSKETFEVDFINSLPYPLTGAQKRVCQEIMADMESSKVMNRLVQGDVGSGKTAVAEIALYKAIKSGYQGVMMAPTEILARQHFDGMSEAFAPFGIRCAFLSGNMGAKHKREIREGLLAGEIDILIGTHAVISKDVEFKRLGLVITDEQHRFGVNQRRLLGEKGNMPDTLVMTATPIPRTLAVILYGDLDVSIIDEMPAGRKPITTKAIEPKDRILAYNFARDKVKEGRQCYVVAPLIEDSEALENTRSAESIYEELCEKFASLKVALLHGNMKQPEKDEIMQEFSKGDIDILVSTVVIEVGINVPNATLMIIENAERFGLAQLHQLRGRVGRGEHKSHCILISDQSTDIARERAKTMVSTSDGFIISEKDLELRGPGDFFGTRQHGLPELKISDLAKHTKVLAVAKNAANEIFESGKLATNREYDKLNEKLDQMFSPNGNLQI